MVNIFEECPAQQPDGLITEDTHREHAVYGEVHVIETCVSKAEKLSQVDALPLLQRLRYSLLAQDITLPLRMRILPSNEGKRPIHIEVRGPADDEVISVLALCFADLLREKGLMETPLFAKL